MVKHCLHNCKYFSNTILMFILLLNFSLLLATLKKETIFSDTKRSEKSNQTVFCETLTHLRSLSIYQTHIMVDGYVALKVLPCIVILGISHLDTKHYTSLREKKLIKFHIYKFNQKEICLFIWTSSRC